VGDLGVLWEVVIVDVRVWDVVLEGGLRWRGTSLPLEKS